MTAGGGGRARPALQIEIVTRSARWTSPRRAAAVVRRAVSAAAGAASTRRAALAIVLTDDSAIRALNRRWRGLDKPTNVLSFPAPPGGGAARGRDAPVHLGDVVIAQQTVAREARAEGKPFEHHLAHLAVHGFLHLVGYDHETRRDADEMERLEVRILKRLGIADPYADAAARQRQDA